MREQIASALDVIVQQSRLTDGTRRIIARDRDRRAWKATVVTMQDIFRVRPDAASTTTARVRGEFQATGTRPKFAGRLAKNGIELPKELFQFKMEV